MGHAVCCYYLTEHYGLLRAPNIVILMLHRMRIVITTDSLHGLFALFSNFISIIIVNLNQLCSNICFNVQCLKTLCSSCFHFYTMNRIIKKYWREFGLISYTRCIGDFRLITLKKRHCCTVKYTLTQSILFISYIRYAD